MVEQTFVRFNDKTGKMKFLRYFAMPLSRHYAVTTGINRTPQTRQGAFLNDAVTFATFRRESNVTSKSEAQEVLDRWRKRCEKEGFVDERRIG